MLLLPMAIKSNMLSSENKCISHKTKQLPLLLLDGVHISANMELYSYTSRLNAYTHKTNIMVSACGLH